MALATSLTLVGQESLVTTYPLTALIIAIAWRFRHRPAIAGFAYALVGVFRGYQLLLYAYPLVRRAWRTLAIGIGVLATLTLTAVAFEPSVFHSFLEIAWPVAMLQTVAEVNLALPHILSMVGLPVWVAWVVTATLGLLALRRRASLFWVLLWMSFAITPLVWIGSVVAGLPLATYVGVRSKWGAVLAGTVVIAVVGTSNYVTWAWPVFLVSTFLGLMTLTESAQREDFLRLSASDR